MVSDIGCGLIGLERIRQRHEEGWTHEHDDEHAGGELIDAAMAYILASGSPLDMNEAWSRWPWASDSFKPGDDVRNLVKAGALIAAEIDRLLRARAKAGA